MSADVLEQAVPDGRDRAGDRRPLRLDQPDQRLGLQETVGHDQVGAAEHRRVGQPPGVGVEHGHHRQDPVAVAHREGVAQAGTHRVQVGGAVAVHHALRHAGGAAGVAHGRGGPLVQLGPVELGRLGGQQLLVVVHLVAGAGQRPGVGGSLTRDRAGQHDVPDRFQAGQDRGQQRHERGLGDDHVVAGVVGDVAELLRVQPEVQGVQDRAHGGNGQVGLEVLGVVPEQGGDPLVAVHAELAQGAGQLGRAGTGLGVGLAADAVRRARDDLTIAEDRGAVPHQPGHGQGHVHHRAEHGPPPCDSPPAQQHRSHVVLVGSCHALRANVTLRTSDYPQPSLSFRAGRRRCAAWPPPATPCS